MDTLDFLYRRRHGHLDPEHYYAWAEHLVARGHESKAVLVLLGNPDMPWSERDRYVETILSELGIGEPSDLELLKHQEELSIRRYLGGELSVRELIRKGGAIYYLRDFSSDFDVWLFLSEDLDNLALDRDDEHRFFTYLDPEDIDGSLRKALKDEGKLDFLGGPEDSAV